MDGGCDVFRQLIRCCVNCLVVSLCTRNDQTYGRTLLKMNWKDFEMTGGLEALSYMQEVTAEMQKRVSAIKGSIHSVYFNLLLNKLASALPANFLLNVYKIKKTVSPHSSQQFLFDT